MLALDLLQAARLLQLTHTPGPDRCCASPPPSAMRVVDVLLRRGELTRARRSCRSPGRAAPASPPSAANSCAERARFCVFGNLVRLHVRVDHPAHPARRHVERIRLDDLVDQLPARTSASASRFACSSRSVRTAARSASSESKSPTSRANASSSAGERLPLHFLQRHAHVLRRAALRLRRESRRATSPTRSFVSPGAASMISSSMPGIAWPPPSTSGYGLALGHLAARPPPASRAAPSPCRPARPARPPAPRSPSGRASSRSAPRPFSSVTAFAARDAEALVLLERRCVGRDLAVQLERERLALARTSRRARAAARRP